jgi:putative FmdB family regulatory protein
MPTYQYKCDDCGEEFEEFQKISDDPIEECPSCGGRTHRLITGGAGFLLKGSGWYVTDYRSDSYKKEAAKETADIPKGKTDKSDKKSTESTAQKDKKEDKSQKGMAA